MVALGLILAPIFALNESPSEKEGKSKVETVGWRTLAALNESPSKKEGK